MSISIKLIFISVILSFVSCNNSDSTGPDGNRNNKLLKSVDFNTPGITGTYESMSFEYDEDSRYKKAVYKYNGLHPETKDKVIYDMIYDNYIFEGDKIKSIDMFSTLDSSSYRINYQYSDNLVSISNSNLVGTDYKFDLQVEYSEDKMVRSQLTILDPLTSSIQDISTTEITYLEDGVAKVQSAGNSGTYYFTMDSEVLNPLNLSNVYRPADFVYIEIFFIGNAASVSGVYSSKEKLDSGDFFFRMDHILDADGALTHTRVQDYTFPNYRPAYSYEYY